MEVKNVYALNIITVLLSKDGFEPPVTDGYRTHCIETKRMVSSGQLLR
jgi:hypothetical protein